MIDFRLYLSDSANRAVVLRALATATGLSPQSLLRVGRDDPRRMDKRHLAAWVLRSFGVSYPIIARLMGRENHTTAIHSVRKVEMRVRNSDAYGKRAEGAIAEFRKCIESTFGGAESVSSALSAVKDAQRAVVAATRALNRAEAALNEAVIREAAHVGS